MADPASSKRNGNEIKQWFITFPQSNDVSKETFIKSLPPLSAYRISREDHEDGGFHLHASIKLKSKGLTKPKLLRWIERKWPNDYLRIHVKPTRSWKNAEDYSYKEDPDTIFFDEDEERKFPMPKETWKPKGIEVPSRLDGADELRRFHKSNKEKDFWIQQYNEGFITCDELIEMSRKYEWDIS